METAVALIVRRAKCRLGGYVCLCNTHVLVSALHDSELHGALRKAWLVLPDGAPVAWLQRRLGGQDRVATRVAGPDLMLRVIDEGREVGLRHYLLGSSDSTLERLRLRLERQLPGCRIVGSYSPPFAERWEPAPSEWHVIRSADADIVWCSLGAPKQELWMGRNAHRLSPSLVVGVGAAFDFHSGAKPRAPYWMQTMGLEWFYRMVREPRRLGPRYLRSNVEFVLRAATALMERHVR
jgi:N-acetylglucosaminyldiphosphoundecaprenol N-acetyl-beta-D-mannosaminyltransferase